MIELPNEYLSGDHGRGGCRRLAKIYNVDRMNRILPTDIDAYECQCDGRTCTECHRYAVAAGLDVSDGLCPSCGRLLNHIMLTGGNDGDTCDCGLIMATCRTHNSFVGTHSVFVTIAAIIPDKLMSPLIIEIDEGDVI